ncbi:PH domain-containing protein [Actinokineospora sp. NBRC 105648]|uniref:PH domain-containing protein n=1 Tax=Actinokineospora sp. NBRC 105648 TaxID=3032206 RepID=UPI0024A4D6CD|nr:PH domain-containing protein [Actinokineospora sp. NBRC 105648]GLZ38549.1 membrane protein [Actinokineospora sp. NBRC 105648]
MAYPDDLLSDGERVVLHKHPHWKMLLLPYLILVVVVGGGIWLAILAQDLSWATIAQIIIGALALILVVWLFFVPFVRWRTTHFIVTTDRVMAREGVINRTGIDIPLSRISSVRFEHGLIDRIVGCGTLIIESSSQEPLEFDDIPAVEKVHTLLYREVNDNPNDDFHRGAPAAQQYPDQGYQDGRR